MTNACQGKSVLETALNAGAVLIAGLLAALIITHAISNWGTNPKASTIDTLRDAGGDIVHTDASQVQIVHDDYLYLCDHCKKG